MKSEIKKYGLIALMGTTIEFVLFKLHYPYPDSSDAHNYIYAAMEHLNISIYPIGYSKFLSAFHYVTHSAIALVCFQYFFTEVSAFLFFYTFCHLYCPTKSTANILFIFLFFNPLFLYLGNYISNDAIFLGVSLIWLAQLLWIIYVPKNHQIITHSILLLLCIMLSNKSYYYPIVSVIAFSLSKRRLPVKLTGIGLPFLLILLFAFFTRNAAYKLTGTRQYSFSAGWQLANNALYMFEYTDSVKFSLAELREIDARARSFYSSASRNVYEELGSFSDNYFLQDTLSPLNLYLLRHYRNSGDSGKLIAYGKASAIFKNYGIYQIQHNSAAYFWEFMLPNVKNYFFPSLGNLKSYNQSQAKMDPITKQWFDYKVDKLADNPKSLQHILLAIFPVLFLLTNILFIGSLLWLLVKKQFQTEGLSFKHSIILLFIILAINFIGSSATSIIVIKNQLLVMVILFSFSLLLVELTDKKEPQKESRNADSNKLNVIFDK